MAMAPNFLEPASRFESGGELSRKTNGETTSSPTATISENDNGCFDCNICLDVVHDPVVTLCGHLYCWPCIYRWLQVKISPDEPDQHHKCPVCKANISDSSLVPLYGRGNSEKKNPQMDILMPQRPLPSSGSDTFITTSSTSSSSHPNFLQSNSQGFYLSHPYGALAFNAPGRIGGDAAMTSSFNPTVGMFGEMVFARMFGNSDGSLYPHPYYMSSYPVVGNTNPRMRRQDIKLDKSLNRVSIFLFCGFILCLLLF